MRARIKVSEARERQAGVGGPAAASFAVMEWFRGSPAALLCAVVLMAVVWSTPAVAEAPRTWTPKQTQQAIAAARALLGTPYVFGGRLRAHEGGTDCLGVIFAALEAATGCGWRSFTVSMTDAFARKEFGQMVEGFAPVRSVDAKFERLRPGDLLFFAGPLNNRGEPAAATVDGVGLWVAHTGMFTGEGRFIVGDHYAEKTIETELRAYLNKHPYPYVFAVRPVSLPNVKVCRSAKVPLRASR